MGWSRGGCTCDPVDVVADALAGREGVAVDGLEQAGLSWQACGALSGCRQAGVQAGPCRRSPGCSSRPGTSVLLDGFEFGGRSWTAARTVTLSVRRAIHRSDAVDGSREHLSLVRRPSLPTVSVTPCTVAGCRER